MFFFFYRQLPTSNHSDSNKLLSNKSNWNSNHWKSNLLCSSDSKFSNFGPKIPWSETYFHIILMIEWPLNERFERSIPNILFGNHKPKRTRFQIRINLRKIRIDLNWLLKEERTSEVLRSIITKVNNYVLPDIILKRNQVVLRALKVNFLIFFEIYTPKTNFIIENMELIYAVISESLFAFKDSCIVSCGQRYSVDNLGFTDK